MLKDFMFTNVTKKGSSIYVLGYNLVTKMKETHRIKSLGLHLGMKATKESGDLISYPNHHFVKKVDFESIYDYEEFLSSYKESGLKVYNEFPLVNKWINENYKDEVPFDIDMINIGILDIENRIVSGLTIEQSIQVTPGEITAVTLYTSKSDKYYIWPYKEEFDLTLFKEDEDFDRIEFRYIENEAERIKDISNVMNNLEKIDCLTGWNCANYDMNYLMNRIERIAKEQNLDENRYNMKMFSPLNLAFRNRKGEPKVKGYSILDYRELYLKYVYKKLESYKLDYVGDYELGLKKVEYEGNLNTLCDTDYGKYLYYNFHDVRIVKKLEDKLKFILLQVQISYESKQNFEDTFSPVRTWESLVYSECVKRGLCLEPTRHHPKVEYPGAFVKKPDPGFLRYIMSFDLNSLYPHLQMGYLISPETIVPADVLYQRFGKYPAFLEIMEWREKVEHSHDIEIHDEIIDKLINREFDLSFLQNEDICLSPSLEFFYKDENSILPMFMNKFYSKRKVYQNKKKELKNELKGNDFTSEEITKLEFDLKKFDLMQLAYKILINSEYGSLANVYFRFYDIRLAKAITVAGRFAIKAIIHEKNKKLNDMYNFLTKTQNPHCDFVVYGDTDSDYICLEKLAPFIFQNKGLTEDSPLHDRIDALDDFANNVIQKIINDKYEDIAKYMNCVQKMFMKRESICTNTIWLSSKKRYLLNVIDMEGFRYDKPQMKATGVEIVKSSIPKIIRKRLFDLMQMILDSDNPYLPENMKKFNKFISDTKKEVMNMEPLELAFPRSITEIKKWEDSAKNPKKGTPIHVYGAIKYNSYLRSKNLEGYEFIGEGEKIRFMYLRTPNKFGTHVISFKDKLPPKFKSLINYNLMLDKTFYSIISLILDEIGLELDYKKTSNSLMGFLK